MNPVPTLPTRGASAARAAAALARCGRRAARLESLDLGAPGGATLRARVASGFVSRLRGLHALPPLGPSDALLLVPCRAVHTWGMDRAIDVLFLDRDRMILEVRTLAPGRSARRRGARAVLETAAGTAARLGLRPGDRLEARAEASR